MLPISPVLQNFARNDLHIFVEGNALRLERGSNGITDAEAKIFEGNGHLSGGAGIRLIPQPHNCDAQIKFGLLYLPELDAVDRGLRDVDPALANLVGN